MFPSSTPNPFSVSLEHAQFLWLILSSAETMLCSFAFSEEGFWGGNRLTLQCCICKTPWDELQSHTLNPQMSDAERRLNSLAPKAQFTVVLKLFTFECAVCFIPLFHLPAEFVFARLPVFQEYAPYPVEIRRQFIFLIFLSCQSLEVKLNIECPVSCSLCVFHHVTVWDWD